MELLDTAWIQCPYCGEVLELSVDRSAGEQSYVEDCQVCCSPIELRAVFGPDGSLALEARREDE